MAKMLILGSDGLVGSRCVELLEKSNQLLLPKISKFDLTNKSSVKNYIKKNRDKFSIIVNFAAYTNVFEAENQRGDKKGACWKINVVGLKNLLSFIDTNKIHYIHISTDMVFPGSTKNPGPYSEDNKPETKSNKLSWYGFTKAEAERIVRSKFGNKATILRLIYPVRANYKLKPDYLRGPLALFDEGKLYPMFVDQQVSITDINEIGVALQVIIEQRKSGIFHASSKNMGTPHKIISRLIEKSRGKKNAVKESSLDEFLKEADNKARYPKFGGLKVEKTEKKLGIKYSTWESIVDKIAKELKV